MDETAYEATIEGWRRAHEATYSRENGWLSQIDLQWFEDDQAVLDVGTFQNTEAGVRFIAMDGIDVRIAGALTRDVVLDHAAQDYPDVLTAGTRSYQVVRRGGALAVRVRDTEAPARRRFRGLSWYPVRPEWRIEGRLVPSVAPSLSMRFTAGQEEDAPCPGQVVFSARGREHTLVPYARPDGSWLFVFRDDSNADETCAMCRYFYATPSVDQSRVELDFNRAAAPICALVPLVTCVLPPPENRLPIRVPAGERRPIEENPS